MQITAHWLPAPLATELGREGVDAGSADDVITSIVAHPLLDRVVMGTVNGRLHVWDPSRRCSVQSLPAHDLEVTKLTYSPTGDYLLTTSTDGAAALYNERFELIYREETPAPLFGGGYSPDGRFIVSLGSDKVIRVHDASTGVIRETLKGQSDIGCSIGWLNSRTLLVGGDQGWIGVWDIIEAKLVKQFRAHDLRISHILVGKGGDWYVTASWDCGVKFWNHHHRNRFTLPSAAHPVTGLVRLPDDRHMAAATWDGMIRFWDVTTGKGVDEARACDDALMGMVYVTSNRRLITCEQAGRLASWSVEDIGVHRFVHRHAGEVYGVCYLPDNSGLLSVGHEGLLKVWEVDSREEISYVDCKSGPLTSVCSSPDGQVWAIGAANGQIRIWNTSRRAFQEPIQAHKETVSALRFLPTNDLLLSSSWDMCVRTWSLETLRDVCSFEGSAKSIAAFDVSLDGRKVATASWDGVVRLYETIGRKRRDLASLLLTYEGHRDRVLSVAIHPDSQFLASGGVDKSIRIWSTAEAKMERVLAGHTDGIAALRYTPDGVLLVSVDYSGRLIFWDAKTGDLVAELTHDHPIQALAVAPDGREVAIGDNRGGLRFASLERPTKPIWVAAFSGIRPPPLWLKGAPPEEFYEVICIHCGAAHPITVKQLGTVFGCKNCRTELQLCPQAIPPSFR